MNKMIEIQHTIGDPIKLDNLKLDLEKKQISDDR
jgi:hypothetical protein